MPSASANPAKMLVEGRLYIGNLNQRVTKQEVQHTFSKFGNLRDVWIARDPPGFAFIEYENVRDAEEAIRMLDGREVLGSVIKVEQSRAQGGRGGGRGGGGRGGGRGGGGRGGGRGGRGGRGGDDRGGSRGGRAPYGRDFGGPSEYGGRGGGGYRDDPRSRYTDPYGDPYAGAYRSRSPIRRRTPPSAAPPRGGRDYGGRESYGAPRDSYGSRDSGYGARDYGREYGSRDYARDYPPAPPAASAYGRAGYERGGYERSYERSYDRGYERPGYDRPPRRSPPPGRR